MTGRQVRFLKGEKVLSSSFTSSRKRSLYSNWQQSKANLDSLDLPSSAVMSSLTKLWPRNTVYYSINSAYDHPSRINNAIAAWEANTYLDFKQKTNEINYVEFVNGPPGSCSSKLGMVGGQQKIYLAPGCYKGQIIHEIGHAIGLFHEQTRHDRENYITIHQNNIISHI